MSPTFTYANATVANEDREGARWTVHFTLLLDGDTPRDAYNVAFERELGDCSESVSIVIDDLDVTARHSWTRLSNGEVHVPRIVRVLSDGPTEGDGDDQWTFDAFGDWIVSTFLAPIWEATRRAEVAAIAAVPTAGRGDLNNPPASKESPAWLYLDCSTGHLEAATMRALSQGDDMQGALTTVAPYTYGAFISVPPDPVTDLALPPDLRDVVDAARRQGCHVVRFDADGTTLDDLPTYDW